MAAFSPDLDLVVSIVLGDVNATDIPQILITPLYESVGFQPHKTLGLTVTIKDGTVLGPGLAIDKVLTIRDVLVTKNIAPEDLETQVWRVYHVIARKMSFQLFEDDPRIGLPLDSGFPDCPLFDPPYIKLPYAEYFSPRIASQPDLVEVYNTLTTCPFCSRSLIGRTTVWCGGNVGFAHQACAPWVTPKPAPKDPLEDPVDGTALEDSLNDFDPY